MFVIKKSLLTHYKKQGMPKMPTTEWDMLDT
jgi:hypothetical protein